MRSAPRRDAGSDQFVLVSDAHSLVLADSEGFNVEVQNVSVDDPVTVRIPLPNLNTWLPRQEDRDSFFELDGAACVHWSSSRNGTGTWSSSGCRAQAVEPRLGASAATLVCACTHLTTFAAAFGFSRTRFMRETPLDRATFVVRRGEMLKINVSAISFEGVPRIVSPTAGANVVAPGGRSNPLVAALTWRAISGGDYTVCVQLSVEGGLPLETRCYNIRVVFCETIVGEGGTSLSAIAATVGTSWRTLFALNPHLVSPHLIEVGSRLRIGRVYEVYLPDLAPNGTLSETGEGASNCGSNIAAGGRCDRLGVAVRAFGSTFALVERENPGLAERRLSRFVFDDRAYSGEEVCFVSKGWVNGCVPQM